MKAKPTRLPPGHDSGAGAHGRRPRLGRLLILLAVSTSVGSIGLGAGGTAGTLLATDLAGTRAVAGLPVAVHLAGSAAGSLVVSRQVARGRRGRGLALGFAVGAAGAVVVIAAAAAGSLLAMLAGSVLLGTANSSIFLTRYAAVEAGTVTGTGRRHQGRALGVVFLATAVGAVISPLLLGPSGALARAAGLPSPTGLYLVAAVVFAASATLLAVASRPGTTWLGGGGHVLREANPPHRARPAAAFGDGAGRERSLLSGLRRPDTLVALLALGGANFVMVGVMTIAPLRLTEHGHSLELVGLAVSLHVAAMFAPGPAVGSLVDRCGARGVVLLGGVLLLATSVVGIFCGRHAMPLVTAHLLLAGLGWSCGVVGGSMALADAVPRTLRPYTEGIGEVAMGVAAIAVALLVGGLPAVTGYCLLALGAAGLLLALVLLPARPRLSPPPDTQSCHVTTDSGSHA